MPRPSFGWCARCGCDWDSYTQGCNVCATRHSVRRNHGTRQPAQAPTTPWWRRKEAA